jgi:hypothetical protein
MSFVQLRSMIWRLFSRLKNRQVTSLHTYLHNVRRMATPETSVLAEYTQIIKGRHKMKGTLSVSYEVREGIISCAKPGLTKALYVCIYVTTVFFVCLMYVCKLANVKMYIADKD